jgi:tetratricopeptide (TPR) repeat protein
LKPGSEQSLAPTELPSDPLKAARDLGSQGRWGEALALLDVAIDKGWNKPAYLSAREQTRRQKIKQEQQLQDRLLIERSKFQQVQLTIFKQLIHLDPSNQRAAKDLAAIQQQLQHQRQQLSACGLRHIEYQPELAEQCLELAVALEPTSRDQLLLDLISEKEKKTEQARAQILQDIRAQQRKNRIQTSLQTAATLYEKDQFNAARKLLNQVLAEEPSNAEAKKLLTQLETRLEGYLENLLKTGDKLYQQGQIEGAQDIWQAALRLDPENALAKEKLERAQRVLENLENLRNAEQAEQGRTPAAQE